MLQKILDRTYTDPETGCIVYKGAKDGCGYGMVHYLGKSRRTHRVVLSISTGVSLDTPMVAMHICDNPSCVNAEHLKWGTKGENNTDRHLKGRNGDFAGEANPAAKLNWEAVNEIRSRPMSISKMAKHWDVSLTQIKRILNFKVWNVPA